MRADALRRREALVRAARRLVAERGAVVALEAVADAAGVGIATLYRNFSSRAEMLDEVLVTILAEVREAAARAAQTAATDPRGAWHGFAQGLVDANLGALTESFADHVAAEFSDAVRTAQAETLVEVERLLTTVQEAGLVREDVSATEVVVALGMVTRPLPVAVDRAVPALAPRLVAMLLAGMRPGHLEE